jgi:hypothetical protein
MSTLTALLGLTKEDGGKFQDIDVINQNLDKIDDYLRASTRFVPLPLGSSTSDATNYNNPFGFQPAYVDMGDHFLTRGVVAHSNTASNLTAADIIARLPSAVGAVQYFSVVGMSSSLASLQVNANGQITVKATPTIATYWVSLDNLKIWK